MRPLTKAILCLALFLGVGGVLRAADVTSAAQQAAGANWNAPAIWSDGLAPSAGKTYRLIAGGNPSRLRNPVLAAGQTTTFAGDSLTIDAGQEIRWKGPGTAGNPIGTIVNLPGVGGNPGLIVNGGLLNTGDDNYNVLIQGKVQFLGNSTIDNTKLTTELNRTMTFQADVSGSGNITIQNSFPTIPVDFQSSANTYNGTWIVNSGYLKGSGNNSLGTNSITMAAGTTLEVNYDLKCFGTITLNGNAQMKLHSFVQVQSAVVNGTPIPAGIYTWAEANAAFPANFPAPGSGGIRVGTPIDAIFQDVATSYIAWEAENKVAITNLGTANWGIIADGTASGGAAIQEQGSGADNNNVSGTARWNLVFRQAGTYHLYIKYQITPCCGANSYKYPSRFGGDLTPADAAWRVSSINEGGHGAPYGVIHEREQNQTAVFATFTVAPGDVGNPLVLMFGNREVPGVTIDRIVLSTDATLANSGDGPFDALINSTGGSQLLAAPRVLSVDSRLNPNGLRVTFNGGVNATGLNPANYSLNNGVTVSGAAYAYDAGGSNIVQLTTTALTPSTLYTVTVSNVQNLQGLVMNPNPTNLTFTHNAGLNQPGGLQVNIYNGANTLALVKTAVANCTAPTFTANTTNVAMEYTTQAAGDVANGNTFLRPDSSDYGTKIFGLFVAPTTGNYQFALSSDDTSELYLSTDALPANKVLLTSQPAWNGFRGYISGNGNPPPALPAPRALIAGRSYYLEVLHQEGGGGDTVSVTVRKPGDPAIADNQAAIPRSMFSTNYSIGCPPTLFFRTLGPVTQSIAPATQTVQERANATFFVGIDGIPPYGIQWYSNNVPVSGATNEVYAFPTLRAADGSQFYAIVRNDFSSMTSSVATLTVINDTTAPTIVSAVGGANRLNASIIFSESMTASSATNIANYQITNAAGATLAITAAIIAPDPSLLVPGGKVVTLTTAAQTPNAQYWVVVNNLTDRAGVPNPIAPNSVASFIATDLDLLAGKVLFRAYNAGGSSTAVDALVNDPLYPNSPDFTQLINGFNTRLANDPANAGRYSGDTRENYGGTMVGHFIPPVSGDWILYTSADDGSRLFMNTNGPSSIGKAQLLNVIPCCGVFAANPTVPVSLVAGQAYYIEALYKEGGGGDFMQIAARLASGDNSALAPIPQAQVAFASKLTINQNPTNITVIQNHNATFAVVATLSGAGAGSQTYQWQRSTDTTGSTFTNIP
ncbi:MAG TPA: PA14 domain-containing protein, partial [Verrucomicrobiae bacterium]